MRSASLRIQFSGEKIIIIIFFFIVCLRIGDGIVYHARWKGEEVALKEFCGTSASASLASAREIHEKLGHERFLFLLLFFFSFLMGQLICVSLCSGRNSNVADVYGYVETPTCRAVVTEYFAKGSLEKLLRAHRHTLDPPTVPSLFLHLSLSLSLFERKSPAVCTDCLVGASHRARNQVFACSPCVARGCETEKYYAR